MKKIYLILIALLASTGLFAQRPEQQRKSASIDPRQAGTAVLAPSSQTQIRDFTKPVVIRYLNQSTALNPAFLLMRTGTPMGNINFPYSAGASPENIGWIFSPLGPSNASPAGLSPTPSVILPGMPLNLPTIPTIVNPVLPIIIPVIPPLLPIIPPLLPNIKIPVPPIKIPPVTVPGLPLPPIKIGP